METRSVNATPVMAQDATAAPLPDDDREMRRRDRMLDAVGAACKAENRAFYDLLARLRASGAVDKRGAFELERVVGEVEQAALWAAYHFANGGAHARA